MFHFKKLRSIPPKRIKKENKMMKKLGIQEPHRESAFDHIVENLKNINRKTFLQRIIYTGEYNHIAEEETIMNYFQDSISKANVEGMCLEPVTGFLLMYKLHYLHIVEGSEDGIIKHLQLLLKREVCDLYIGKSKILILLNHIGDRMCNDWSFYSGVPKKLLTFEMEDCDLPKTMKHIFYCVNKLYSLIEEIEKSGSNRDVGVRDESQHNFDLILSKSSVHQSSMRILNTFSSMQYSTKDSAYGSSLSSFFFNRNTCPYRDVLPEAEILQSLILSKHTLKLTEYLKLCKLEQRDIYEDRVWPTESGYVQYDVFDKQYERETDIFKRESKLNRKSFFSSNINLQTSESSPIIEDPDYSI